MRSYFILGIGQTADERAEGLYFPPYEIQLWVDGEEYDLEQMVWNDKEGVVIGDPIIWHLFYYIVEPYELTPTEIHYFSIAFTWYNLHPSELQYGEYIDLEFFYGDLVL